MTYNINNGKRKILFWNVDTTYDFMRSDEDHLGTLVVEGAKGIEGNLEKLTKIAELNNYRVINTKDWHNEDSVEISETPDYVNTFPAHSLIGTKGAEYVPATKPENPYTIDWQDGSDFDLEKMLEHRNIVIHKDHFDAFQGNPRTEEIVEAIDPQVAVVYGVATNVCVDYAVMSLLAKGVEVYVPLDAIKELPGLPLNETLQKWKDNGAILCEVDSLEKYLTD